MAKQRSGENGKIYTEHDSFLNKPGIVRQLLKNECVIHYPVWIGDKVVVGKRVKIQAFAYIPNGVTLEDDVFISPGVVFTNDKYPPSKGKEWRETIVKKGATIGANATILPGITIGEEAVIGAGAVVLKDVAPGETYINDIKQKEDNEQQRGHESPETWDNRFRTAPVSSPRTDIERTLHPVGDNEESEHDGQSGVADQRSEQDVRTSGDRPADIQYAPAEVGGQRDSDETTEEHIQAEQSDVR